MITGCNGSTIANISLVASSDGGDNDGMWRGHGSVPLAPGTTYGVLVTGPAGNNNLRIDPLAYDVTPDGACSVAAADYTWRNPKPLMVDPRQALV